MKGKGIAENEKFASRYIARWFKNRGWEPFPFQDKVNELYACGSSGLLNAPTGSGKTLALWRPALESWIGRNPEDFKHKKNNGLRLIWVTPLRALATDITSALQNMADELEVPWKVSKRTGDTPVAEKKRQKKDMPEALVITPESLHILLSSPGYPELFKSLEAIVVDEWHELIGTKRGVQVELAISRLVNLTDDLLKVWGISATIGNLEEAKNILLAPVSGAKGTIVRADVPREIEIVTVLPDEIERFPWSGHIGVKLVEKVIPVIRKSRSTLVFTNTRSQAEIWYQYLLTFAPDLAGTMAIHHGSLDREIRDWVEAAIHEEKLKVVVCTSSLDLGVDFRPVETVIQVGSPKGVARFMQRAGRSGHRPGEKSVIYFVPTNSLEILESAALQDARDKGTFEERVPYLKPYDVLIQFLLTLASSEGFIPDQIYPEVKNTFAFQDLSRGEFDWMLDFISTGGETLREYEEYSKAGYYKGIFRINNKRTAMRHRMSIGTIVGDSSLRVKFLSGGTLGTIEESFLSRLKPGDNFWFAGRPLQLVRIRSMTAWVKKSSGRKGVIPSWMGGRMPLSGQLAARIRDKLEQASNNDFRGPEMQKLKPLLELQAEWSYVPGKNELLIEKIHSREGTHLFIYPFEGRNVHEGLSALLAYRISQFEPITFSIAMNDYGFELLSEKDIPIEDALGSSIFSEDNLISDIRHTVNATEMSRRKFRDIAIISGLMFTGYPGKIKQGRHLQTSASLLYDVFREYDPGNPLLIQAEEEALRFQLEEERLRKALRRINSQKILFSKPKKITPFAFPIMVDGMREKVSSEKLMDRIARMQLTLEKEAGKKE